MDTKTVEKLEYILSGYNVSYEEKQELIQLIEDYHKEQCTISGVVGQSEQLVCPECGSQNVYEFTYTDGIGCNSCGHQWAN